jgi:hypothetical protein
MSTRSRRSWLVTLSLASLTTALVYSPILQDLPFDGVIWQERIQLPVQQTEDQRSSVQEEEATPLSSPSQEAGSAVQPGEETVTIPLTPENLWSHMVQPMLQAYALFVLMAFLGLMSFVVPVVIGFFVIRHFIRKHRPKCETCQVPLKQLHQEDAKPYLDAGQMAEVEVNSVLHSVLICPQCNQRQSIRTVAPSRLAIECPSCHYKTLAVVDQQTLVKPTYHSTGEATIHRVCRHCGYTTTKIEVLGKRDRHMSEQQSSFWDDDWSFNRYLYQGRINDSNKSGNH